MAAIRASKAVFGEDVTTKGCFFHLCQSTHRKVRELGLISRYKTDDRFKKMCGMLDGLAFLPPDLVPVGLDYIRGQAPTDLDDLIDYFDATATFRSTCSELVCARPLGHRSPRENKKEVKDRREEGRRLTESSWSGQARTLVYEKRGQSPRRDFAPARLRCGTHESLMWAAMGQLMLGMPALYRRGADIIATLPPHGRVMVHPMHKGTVVRSAVEELSSTMAAPTFAAADYVVLVGFLLLSMSIGVYFAWADRRRQSNRIFLTANKQLGWFPVSVSMMASFLSSNGILGLPAEVFLHGSTLWIGTLSSTIAILLAAVFFMPMYYKMDITSINEYLEHRFKSAAVKNVACGIFILCMLLYTGVVLYGPSLALGSVTRIPVWASILLNGLVCTLYTSIGGIKAVVWTDVVQMVLILVGYVMVIVSGLCHIGGIYKAWEIGEKGGRMNFLNFSVSPYDTFTSWNILFCWTVLWMSSYCASQTQVQRYTSIASLKDARKALLLNIPGVSVTLILSIISGIVLFAVYSDCDPRLTGDIKKADENHPEIVIAQVIWPGLAVSTGLAPDLAGGPLRGSPWARPGSPAPVFLSPASASRSTHCLAPARVFSADRLSRAFCLVFHPRLPHSPPLKARTSGDFMGLREPLGFMGGRCCCCRSGHVAASESGVELTVEIRVQACGSPFPRQRCVGWLSRAITAPASLRNHPGIVVA
ncbi:hypothetical protein HPB47_002204 [Ixodes persulcatus]|uniref:Uncharacterized protein n=1 Tax=Ixodes persulcatus TaxID=34615 RepID=A0AC60PLZ7_IXOPE|nr:hypothetical protein HPB47_002204 [Ixodes persulcatus]